MKKSASINGHWQLVQELASMLFEIADLFEEARVEELVKKYSQFIGIITTLLDNRITWGKVIVFFSFSVSFTIYLCMHQRNWPSCSSSLCLGGSSAPRRPAPTVDTAKRRMGTFDHYTLQSIACTFEHPYSVRKIFCNIQISLELHANRFCPTFAVG